MNASLHTRLILARAALGFCGLVSLLAVSCSFSTLPAINGPITGRSTLVYLETAGAPSARLQIEVKAVEFQSEDGKVARLHDAPVFIDTQEGWPDQTSLGETRFAPGRYRKLRVTIGTARIRGKKGWADLELSSTDLEFSCDFRLDDDSSTVVFLRWDLGNVVSGGFRFDPDIKVSNSVTSPRGSSLYVSNSGSDSLIVIDWTRGRIVGGISVGVSPGRMAITRTGARLFVANSGSDDISRVDTDLNRENSRLELDNGDEPVAVALGENDTVLFTANWGSDTVTKIDTQSEQVLAKVPVGSGPIALAEDERSRRLFVVENYANSVEVLDSLDLRSQTTLQVGSGPRDICLDANRRRAYVTNYDSGSFSVIDLESLRVIETIQVGTRPWGCVLDPVRQILYIALAGEGEVVYYQLGARARMGAAPLAGAPSLFRFAPDRARFFVVDKDGGNLSVVNRTLRRVEATISVGAKPVDVVLAAGQ